MDVEKPHCPACHKLLDGPLVVSRCNHVFHRDCLPAEDAPCPKCQQPDAGKNALELFGLGLGDGGSSDMPATNLPPGAREAAVELVMLERKVADQRRVAEGCRQRLEDAKVATENQGVKLKEAGKAGALLKQRYDSARAELSKLKANHATLYEQACRSREQSVVAEYLEMVHNSKDSGADAANFLCKIATATFDAAPLLTEMTRLRDHHRARVNKLQREHVQMSQREARNRREIVEVSRAVAEYQRKLQRSDSQVASLSQATEVEPPSAKRPRIGA